MADDRSAVEGFADALGRLPVVLPDDHVPDLYELGMSKIPVFPVDLPDVPKQESGSSEISGQSLLLTIKSLKPPHTFVLNGLTSAESILTIKQQLSKEYAAKGAPSPEITRLLLKGKVLSDEKLLKDYLPADAGGELTLNLMLKSGSNWDWKPSVAASSAPAPTPPTVLELPVRNPSASRHARSPSEGMADSFPVPSLTLSTPLSPPVQSPESTHGQLGVSPSAIRSPVPLELVDPDPDHVPYPHPSHSRPGSRAGGRRSRSASRAGSLHGGDEDKFYDPQFWVRLRGFLGKEFSQGPMDDAGEKRADEVFEDWLLASKNSLSASDIARIRDAVGITAMGGG